MNEMDQDQGLTFHLAQFQARGYPHTRGEQDGRTVPLEPSSQPNRELLLGGFWDKQQNDEFKMSLKKVELEHQQQQDQSPNMVVDTDTGK